MPVLFSIHTISLTLFFKSCVHRIQLTSYSVLDWWNTVNVSAKGQGARLKEPHRAVQDSTSTSLEAYAAQFEENRSGHGASRIQCLTHDAKKALMQTMRGLAALCRYLLEAGFSYVLLREIQSDRIEGDFRVYRQSTGGNAFMSVGDVTAASKKTLASHACSHFSPRIRQ